MKLKSFYARVRGNSGKVGATRVGVFLISWEQVCEEPEVCAKAAGNMRFFLACYIALWNERLGCHHPFVSLNITAIVSALYLCTRSLRTL